MKTKLYICFWLIALFASLRSLAGHDRSGYISYTCLQDSSTGQYTQTYHFKIITYTDPTNTISDQCAEAVLLTNLRTQTTYSFTCYRTNTTPNIELESLDPPLAGCRSGYALGEGLMLVYPDSLPCPAKYLYEGVKYNIYEGNYTFSDTGLYVFGTADPTLTDGLHNIGGGSNSVIFALVDTLKITSNLFYNNSPVVSNSLVDSVCAGQPFVYNIGITDAVDNDSLSYAIIPFITGTPESTLFPPAAASFIPVGMAIDAVNGNLSWQPTLTVNCFYGLYEIDILVKEYRRISGIMKEIASQVIALQLNVICCNEAGINNLTGSNTQIKVYPNPFTNEFTIENKSKMPITKAQVTDVLGREIISYTPNAEELINVNTSGFAKGVYFIKIYNGTNNSIFKLIRE